MVMLVVVEVVMTVALGEGGGDSITGGVSANNRDRGIVVIAGIVLGAVLEVGFRVNW